MEFKLGELFCGPGGLGYAAITAQNQTNKIVHAWATDYDRDTCKTYTKNICRNEPKTVICKDIRELDFQKLKDISLIDALVFGFPCNDFSMVGKQKGLHGEFGPLYSYGVKALNLFQPKWFLAENVGGLRNANEGNALNRILSEMKESGYSVYPHLYKFNEYSVPQNRQRIIIVGIRKDVNVIYKVPSPRIYENCNVSVQYALEHPPIKQDAFNHEFTIQSSRVVERLKHIKPGENAFTADLPEDLRLNVRGARMSQIYRRLEADKPSYTITGSGGGGTHVYHWKENRALTNRERARLQTFNDDYEFIGSKESVRRQIGMAVPVRGARIIFESILKSFAYEDYEYVRFNMNPLIQEEHLEKFIEIYGTL